MEADRRVVLLVSVRAQPPQDSGFDKLPAKLRSH